METLNSFMTGLGYILVVGICITFLIFWVRDFLKWIRICPKCGDIKQKDGWPK